VTSLRFLMFKFWNYYVLKLLRLETITFSDAKLSDIKVVLCYVLSQYPWLLTWLVYGVYENLNMLCRKSQHPIIRSFFFLPPTQFMSVIKWDSIDCKKNHLKCKLVMGFHKFEPEENLHNSESNLNLYLHSKVQTRKIRISHNRLYWYRFLTVLVPGQVIWM
jgi:hypothetical protein